MRRSAPVLLLVAAACGQKASGPAPAPPRGQSYAEYLGDSDKGDRVETARGLGEDAMILHFIDVGQGSATLVEFPCGALLIDTGGEENEKYQSEPHLLAYLDDFFERRADLGKTLDSLIITHPHIDHTRSIRAVVQRYKVLNVLDNGDIQEDIGGEPQIFLHEWLHNRRVGHLDVAAADMGESGLTGPIIDPIAACPETEIDPEIIALWGGPLGREEVGHDPNNDSIVLRLSYGKATALLPGDIEVLAIARLIKQYSARPEILDTDIYQVPHHGSRHSTAQGLVRLVTPKIAVISAGPYERKLGTQPEYSARAFGHPNRESVDHLLHSEHGVTLRRDSPQRVWLGIRGAWKETPSEFEQRTIEKAVYSTGWDGDVVVTARPDGSVSVATAGR